MKPSIKKVPVSFWLALAPFFWGANFHLAHYSVQYLPPNTIGSLRFVLASLLLIPLFLARERLCWEKIKPHLPVLVMVGALGVFGYNFLFFKAMKTTSATNGALLMACNPLLILLLSKVWHQAPILAQQWLGVSLGLAGVLIVVANGSWQALFTLQFSTGDCLLLIVSCMYALSNVLTHRYLAKASALSITLVSTLAGTFLYLIVFALEVPPSARPLALIPFQVWGAIAAMAIGGSVIAYLAWNYGIIQAGAAQAGLYLNLTPLYAAIIALCLGHQLQASQGLGGLCIIAGIILASMPGKITGWPAFLIKKIFPEKGTASKAG